VAAEVASRPQCGGTGPGQLHTVADPHERANMATHRPLTVDDRALASESFRASPDTAAAGRSAG